VQGLRAQVWAPIGHYSLHGLATLCSCSPEQHASRSVPRRMSCRRFTVAQNDLIADLRLVRAGRSFHRPVRDR
jgi:hypothetical protein